MLEKLIRFSLKQRYIVLSVAVLVIGAGVWAWLTLKIEAYPDVADTQVEIITTYDGRPAEEVEQQVTIPIERAVNAVPHVINRRSRTIFGLSVIDLTFDENTNDYFARQQVLEKLQDASLPDGVQPSLGPLSGPVDEILRYVIEGKGKSPMELRELQDWVITPKILQAAGTADIENFGGLVRRFNVVMNPVQLDKYKLTIQNVADAITANNSGTGGNVIKSGASQLSIRSVGRITKAEDIEQIVLAAQNGVPITVKDVASVEIGVLPPSGIFSYTDKDRGIDNENGVEGIVQMRRGENPSEVLQNIKEKIAELNNGLLPKGVQLIVTYDRQDLVDNTLETVSRTIFEGITIVTIILVFFLGNLRAALAVAMTIPLSMLFAFFMMKMTGIPANLLSLGGIDFGIIVDSAIVMVESISRHISHASDEEKKKGVLRLIFISASEVQRQIFFAVVIIVLAYLPLFTLQRVEGKLFSPTAYTFSYAVFGSMLLALTVVPIVCSFLFTKKYKEWENPAFGWLEKHYRTLMAWVLQNAKVAIGIGVVAVVIGIGLGTTIGTEYLPESKDKFFSSIAASSCGSV